MCAFFKVLAIYKDRFSTPFRSVVATGRISEGHLVPLCGKIFKRPGAHTIRINMDEHILDPIGSYVNHSCTPTSIVIQKTNGSYLKVIKNLVPGDELTLDYFVNEKTPLYSGFVCNTCNTFVDSKCPRNV